MVCSPMILINRRNQIIPDSFRISIDSGVYPRRESISSVCSPSSGGGCSSAPGVSDSLICTPVCLILPAVGWSISTSMFLWSTWGVGGFALTIGGTILYSHGASGQKQKFNMFYSEHSNRSKGEVE